MVKGEITTLIAYRPECGIAILQGLELAEKHTFTLVKIIGHNINMQRIKQ
jgi:hypothetical protein